MNKNTEKPFAKAQSVSSPRFLGAVLGIVQCTLLGLHGLHKMTTSLHCVAGRLWAQLHPRILGTSPEAQGEGSVPLGRYAPNSTGAYPQKK